MSRLVHRLNLTFSRLSALRNIRKRSFSLQRPLNLKDKNFCSKLQVKTFRTSSALPQEIPIDYDGDIEPNILEFDEFFEENQELRYTLYPDNFTELQKLNEASSVEEILRVISEKSDSEITKEVVCQTVIVLWQTLKPQATEHYGPVQWRPKIEELNSIQKSVFMSPEMTRVLQKLQEFVEDGKLSFDEMSCCLMYLNKLGMQIRNPLQQKVIETFLDKFQAESDAVTMSAVSRFVVSIFSETGLYPYLTCIKIIPYLNDCLLRCTDREIIRFITICFLNLAGMIPDDMKHLYKSKVEELVKTGVLNDKTIKTNLKILLYLYDPEWTIDNTKLTRDLILLTQQEVPTLTAKQIFYLFKHIRSSCEPWNFIPEIVKRAKELMTTTPCPELISCLTLEMLPDRQKALAMELKSSANDLLESPTNFLMFFYVLRQLKKVDTDLCYQFWDRIVQFIESNAENLDISNTFRQIHRYMHFNSNFSGTFRHKKFEKTILDFLYHDIQHGTTALMPSPFSRATAFIVAYSNIFTADKELGNYVLEKMEDMWEQFNIYDCLQMSKGVQIAYGLRYKNYISASEAPYLLKFEEILNKCAERHLALPHLSITDVGFILKSFNKRKCSRKNNMFQKIITKFDEVVATSELSSRIIREVCVNLIVSSYRSPGLFDKIIEYICRNSEYVGALTLEKVLWYFYTIGYSPVNEEFFAVANKILKRDFDFLSSLMIIQSCLALTYMKALDKDMISHVFNINFIKRVEEEIQNCYNKARYPDRVQNYLMELNRAVCLHYPEANVPWFQQNYIEAQMAKEPNYQTRFSSDVKKELLELVKNPSHLKQSLVTPYGYRIDYVLYLNDKKEFIAPPPIEDQKILEKVTKLAIVPLLPKAFCENSTDLKGSEALKKYHLEVLGYKVVVLMHRDWYSMYLNLPGARQEYLKRLLGVS
ncbi:uncharacterized protein LOC134832796 [Culicoides brevitarsis]|uniref:uncharacterized protein LOC134832796 n=1 Tax=Culicoides brevitarsis TaxID=469753 RepID=UPI00307B3305